MELLKKLYNIYSPSYGEDKMVKFLKGYCRKLGGKVTIDKNNNIFITKGLSDSYPCVVAHTDQVSNHHHSKDFRVVRDRDILYGYSQKNHRKEGLGADDKNGIWVALKCLEKYKVIKVALFTGEEIGCKGSSACDKSFFADCRFVLQCDRRNAGDLIVNICGDLCSDEFITDIGYEKFGYKMTDGLCTDVEELRESIPISMVNMSCGYYKPHTDEEYTKFSELQNCFNFVCHIIENCTKVYEFPLNARNTLFEDKYEGLYGGYSSWSKDDDWYTGSRYGYDEYYEDSDLALFLYDEIINNKSDTIPVEPYDLYNVIDTSYISMAQMEDAFIMALALAVKQNPNNRRLKSLYSEYFKEVYDTLWHYAIEGGVKDFDSTIMYKLGIGEKHLTLWLFTENMSATLMYADEKGSKCVSLFSIFQFVHNMKHYGTPLFDDDIIDIAENECKYLDLSLYEYEDVKAEDIEI